MWLVLLAIVVIYIVWDRVTLWQQTKGLPGPAFSLPFLGGTIQMVMKPWDFWREQEKLGAFSWNTLAGKVVYFANDTNISRAIFANAKGNLRLWLIFGAKAVLGEHNMAFLHGPKHTSLRRSLLPLFTRKALSTYLGIQTAKTIKHLDQWVEMTKGNQEAIRNGARELNVDTSTEVFVGPYIPQETRKTFSDLYWVMNAGILSFPISLPGTPLWKAIAARKKLIKILEVAARESKAKMQAGAEPECLLDFWMADVLVNPCEMAETDEEIAFVVLDFLFASQDASTSSVVWSVQVLAENPDVLAKVREEQARIRPNNEPLTYEHLQQITYTNQVVKEVLRYRPPAPMVPHIAVEAVTIEEGGKTYNIPKGGVLLPSIWCSSFQGFTDPYRFDPERFNEERQEHIKYAKNWLVFGSGNHMCLGKDYAMNHLTAFVAVLASNYDWTHFPTPRSQDIAFLPTLVPEDGCIVQMRHRAAPTAAQ